MEKQDLVSKLGKVNDRIQILQIARNVQEQKTTRYESRTMVLNQAQDKTQK